MCPNRAHILSETMETLLFSWLHILWPPPGGPHPLRPSQLWKMHPWVRQCSSPLAVEEPRSSYQCEQRHTGPHTVWEPHYNTPLPRVGSVSPLPSCLHALCLPTAIIPIPLSATPPHTSRASTGKADPGDKHVLLECAQIAPGNCCSPGRGPRLAGRPRGVEQRLRV